MSILLGPITSGTIRLAMRARDAVVDSGQAAIFASRVTGMAVAVPYTDPSFDWLIRRHAEHLVGVYTDTCGKTSELRQQIQDDMTHHLTTRRAA